MILAMGLAYGGLAQVIAGVMEYKRGNTFGTVAFSPYGLFCRFLVALLIFPKIGFWDTVPPSPLQPATNTAMAAYFFMWGLFTFIMFFATLKANRACIIRVYEPSHTLLLANNQRINWKHSFSNNYRV